MNFTFVSHKGARPERSELVKSHVMRESQKKRKELKQRHSHRAAGATQQPSCPGANHPAIGYVSQLDFQNQSSTPDFHAHNATTSVGDLTSLSTTASVFDIHSFAWPVSASPPFGTDISSSVQHNAQPPWLDIQNTLDVNPEQTQSMAWTHSDISHEADINFQTAFGHHDTLDIFQHDMGSSSVDVPPNLTLQPLPPHPAFMCDDNLDSDAEWASRLLIDKVSEVASYYTSTLNVERPGLSASSAATYWQGLASVNPKTLFATVLVYCAYRDIVKNIDRNDHHYFRDRALRLINSAMQNPDTAIADDNMGAVQAMCMYENVKGSDHISPYLRGLRRMVDMRGGINNLDSSTGSHLAELIILQDTLHATCSNTPPFMFDISGPLLRDIRTSGFEHFYPQSPLRVVNDAGFARPPSNLQTCFKILRDAFDGLEMLCIEAFDPDTAADEAEAFNSRREKFWSHLVQAEQMEGGDEEVPSTVKRKVEVAVRLAAKIHFRACTFRTQHDDGVNEGDMKRLCATIRDIDIGFWRVAHYVYLWILLTGGAAARGHPEQRPYFVSEILRLGLSIGLFDWRAFRQAIGNFLWLQQFLRQAQPRPVTLRE